MGKFLDTAGFVKLWNKICSALKTKQDVLVSGENIKTVNGQSVIGKGDLEIKANDRLADDVLNHILVTATAEKTENVTANVVKEGNKLAFTFGIPVNEAKDGKTPYIGLNGNWWVGDTDTGVKAVQDDGSSYEYILPTATATIKGGVKIGKGLIMNDEVLSVDENYIGSGSGTGGSGTGSSSTQIDNTLIPLFLFKVTPAYYKDSQAYGKLPDITYKDGNISGSTNGWINTDATPGDNQSLWMIYGLFTANGVRVGAWNGPWCIASNGSSNGEDNDSLEYAYILPTGEVTQAKLDEMYSQLPSGKTTADDIISFNPENRNTIITDKWTDNPQGISADYPIEYASIRVRPDGEWCKPFIWAAWGTKGLDGDGVEYIYKLEADITSLANPTPNGYATLEEYQKSEYIPNGWSDEPQNVSAQNKACYVSVRKYDGKSQKWLAFSTPVLWAYYNEPEDFAVTYHSVFTADDNGDRSATEEANVKQDMIVIRNKINNNTLGALPPYTCMVNDSSNEFNRTWQTNMPTNVKGFWIIKFAMSNGKCINGESLYYEYIGGASDVTTIPGADGWHLVALYIPSKNNTIINFGGGDIGLTDYSWRNYNGIASSLRNYASYNPINPKLEDGWVCAFVAYAYADTNGNLQQYDWDGNGYTTYWSTAGYFAGMANNAGTGGRGLDGMPGVSHQILYTIGSTDNPYAKESFNDNNILKSVENYLNSKEIKNSEGVGQTTYLSESIGALKRTNSAYLDNKDANTGCLWIVQFEVYSERESEDSNNFVTKYRNASVFRGTPLDANSTQTTSNAIVYSAGVYNSDRYYKIESVTSSTGVTYSKVPYVIYNSSNDESPNWGMYLWDSVSNMTADEVKGVAPTNTAYWKKITEEDALYTKILLANRGQIGTMAFYSDWMYSVNGTPDGKFMDFTGDFDKSTSNFIPNFAINTKTGDVYMNGGSTKFNSDGSGQIGSDINWDMYGHVTISSNAQVTIANPYTDALTIEDGSIFIKSNSNNGGMRLGFWNGSDFTTFVTSPQNNYIPAIAMYDPDSGAVDFVIDRNSVHYNSQSTTISCYRIKALEDITYYCSTNTDIIELLNAAKSRNENVINTFTSINTVGKDFWKYQDTSKNTYIITWYYTNNESNAKTNAIDWPSKFYFTSKFIKEGTILIKKNTRQGVINITEYSDVNNRNQLEEADCIYIEGWNIANGSINNMLWYVVK